MAVKPELGELAIADAALSLANYGRIVQEGLQGMAAPQQ